MRYKPCPRHPFQDTARKRAALRRKQHREREDLPLFAEQIAAAQPSEDAVMEDRASASAIQETRDRCARAMEWRDARRRINALPPKQRQAIRIAWNCAPYPGDPSRLLGMLRSLENGTLDPTASPFPLARTDGTGARIHDMRVTDVDWRFLSILTCRDIAAAPDDHSIATRRAAYTHLQKAADINKDRARGFEDRVLAARLWLRMGELDDAVRKPTRRGSGKEKEALCRGVENSPEHC